MLAQNWSISSNQRPHHIRVYWVYKHPSFSQLESYKWFTADLMNAFKYGPSTMRGERQREVEAQQAYATFPSGMFEKMLRQISS